MSAADTDLLIRILKVANEITFSKNQAVKIVGGLARFEKLDAQGKIRYKKNKGKLHAKLQCNAVDVLMHARPKD